MINAHALGNVGLMLLVTVSLVFLLAFIFKLIRRMSPEIQSVQILGGTTLGNKSKVVLIEACDTRLLVGVTDKHIKTLHVFKNDLNPHERNIM